MKMLSTSITPTAEQTGQHVVITNDGIDHEAENLVETAFEFTKYVHGDDNIIKHSPYLLTMIYIFCLSIIHII